MIKSLIPLPVKRFLVRSWRRVRRFIFPVFRIYPRAFLKYGWYARSWRKYARLPGAEPLHLEHAYPILHDLTPSTPFDAQYFYQSVWAAQEIEATKEPHHIDVGSLVLFVAMLTPFTHVSFVDIRPLKATIDNFTSVSADILGLPFADQSVASISCLHVAEHIGLGRYGDALNPDGTRQAARELARVLAVGGHLYFSLPVGKSRVHFNAHRVHSPTQILKYFEGLRLVEFSIVDDHKRLIRHVDPSGYEGATYACGLYIFTRDDFVS